MPASLQIPELEDTARRRTGLDDFGAGDWRPALARLVTAAETEARLSNMGRAILRMQIVDRLVNRLEITAWAARHPEIHDERVEAPLVLATLPRTGQTAAGWIFDRDPALRSLLRWFAKRPIPPPGPGANEDDPRIAHERAVVAAIPEAVRAMHLSAADEPDECHWLISNDFKIPHEIYTMRIPSYYRWTRDEADMGAAYAYYLLQLRILQSRTPGRRWVLKNSPHLLFLHEMHDALPDAIFVQLHRDPLKVLASNCRLATLLRRGMSDEVDPAEVGENMLELLGDYLTRLLRFRDDGRSRPWIDVRFRDFVADPLREVERVYETAALPLGPEARAAMAAWVEEHPRRDLVRARPADLTAWHIDPARARAVFADYCDRFDVTCDGI